MKKILITASIIIVIIATILLISVNKNKNSVEPDNPPTDTTTSTDDAPQKEGVIKDRDTDETYDPAVAQVFTGGEKIYPDTSTALFGVSDLISKVYKKRSTIGNIPSDINIALYDYGAKHLDGAFKSLTIVPDSLEADAVKVTGSLRLGQGEMVVPFRIDIITNKGSGERGYVTINQGGSSQNGTYVYYGGLTGASGQNFSIQQVKSGSRELVIDGVNKEGALQYIKGVGYKVPDIPITFSNYRSPF